MRCRVLGWLLPFVLGAAVNAGAAPATRCPAGRFLLPTNAGALVQARPPGPDAVVLGDDGTVAIDSGCPATKARLKATRAGTRVKARWAKNACAPLTGRARLEARLDAGCSVLRGTFRAKKVKRSVAARRSACGDGVMDLAGGETCDLPPVPERVTPQLDPARATTATLTPVGGVVEATAADGTHYRLDVPAGALIVDEAITLTPVVAIPDLPLRRGLVAAVEFGPDGLQLHQPATLTITLPAAPDPTGLVGFGYQGAGEQVHLDLAQIAGATLTLRLAHFSALGAALAAPEDLAALAAQTPLSEPTEWYFISQLALLLQQGAPAAVYATLFRDWDDAVVSTFVVDHPPEDDPELRRAVREYHEWAWRVQFIPIAYLIAFDAADQASLDSRLAAAKAGIASGLRAGVERANIRCLALQNVAGAEDALRWQAIAAAVGVGTAAEQLDLATVVAGLCIEVVYVETAYPFPATAPLVVGQPGMLRLQVGWRFANGGPIVFAQSVTPPAELVLTVTPTHTVEGPVAYGTTEAGGIFEHLYTPDGTGEVILQVETCVSLTGQPQRLIDTVCQEALIVRGLVVTPATVTLAPGGTQQFAAALFGEPATGVVWSTDGGTIGASSGLYTAPVEPGTYIVTATVAGAGVVATASVTVAPLDITFVLTHGVNPHRLTPGVDARLVVAVRRNGRGVPGAQFVVESATGGTVSPTTWVTGANGQFNGATARLAVWSPVLVVTASVTLPGETPIVVRAPAYNRADVSYAGQLVRSPCGGGVPSTEEWYVSFYPREPASYGVGAFHAGLHYGLDTARFQSLRGAIDGSTLSGLWEPHPNPGSFPLAGTLADGHLAFQATITSSACPQGVLVSFSGDHVSTNLVVTPSAVTVAAGTTQQFTATAPFGEPPEAELVTWEATGGGLFEIDPLDPATGLYTAPQQPGSYTVVAERPMIAGGADVRYLVGTATVIVP